VRNIEGGAQNAHAKTLGALADALHCDVHDLFVRNPKWRRA
jgi:DNA-binding Xre family transcriptional regulator